MRPLIRSRHVRFILICGLLWSLLTSGAANTTGENYLNTSNSSSLDIHTSLSNSALGGIDFDSQDAFSLAQNHAPDTPSISGPARGMPMTDCSYSASAVDPDGDPVRILIDWGDGRTSLLAFVPSESLVNVNHSWNESGVYQIRAKASDYMGASSDWSESLSVIINTPPNKPSTPSGPRLIRPGSSQTYNISAFDPDDYRLNYTINWGDGATSTVGPAASGMRVNANHTWLRTGMYRVKAYATDPRGANSAFSESISVVVDIPPGRPSLPTGPSMGMPGTFFEYNITATDPDGDRVRYLLDWGDRTISSSGFIKSGSVAGMNHSWKKSGIYYVRAMSRDVRGANSAWSDSLRVAINSPPESPLKPFGPAAIYAWGSFSYSTSASDPDNDSLRYILDWGDGNSSETGFYRSGSNASLSHIWNNTGSYQLRAKAVDGHGFSSNWSAPLDIIVMANARPNAPLNVFGPSSGYRGLTLNYFTLAEDQDNDNVTYTFDWGDGTNSSTDSRPSGSVENAAHTWTKSGEYDLRACAVDSKGASSPWSAFKNVAIADNDPPNAPATPSGPISGNTITSYRYATSADDPDGDKVRYVFDWGDGTTSWTGLGFIRSGTTESMLHKWNKGGAYLIRAMAMDDNGASSAWSDALAINIS